MRKSRREVYNDFVSSMDMSVLDEPARQQVSFVQQYDEEIRMIVGSIAGALVGWAIRKTYRMIRRRLT